MMITRQIIQTVTLKTQEFNIFLDRKNPTLVNNHFSGIFLFEYCKNPLEAIEKFFDTPADKPVSEIYEPCKYPFSNMMINPAGDVYPCLSQKIGNIREKSVKEVFNLPHYRCFRKNLKAAKVFGACQMCCELCIKEQMILLITLQRVRSPDSSYGEVLSCHPRKCQKASFCRFQPEELHIKIDPSDF